MKKLLLLGCLLSSLLVVTAQKSNQADRPKSEQERLNDAYCTGLFKSAEGQIFDLTTANNVSGYLNVLDWLEGRVAGLQVYRSRSGVTVPVIRGTVAGVYVDEMPVNLSYLNSLNNFEIAMIKVIKSPFMGGFNGAGGAIAIYTLPLDEEEEE